MNRLYTFSKKLVKLFSNEYVEQPNGLRSWFTGNRVYRPVKLIQIHQQNHDFGFK